MVNGRFALRACIVNFRTSQADIDALPPLLARIGREADQALRNTKHTKNASARDHEVKPAVCTR